MYIIKRIIDDIKGKEWIHAKEGFDYMIPVGNPRTRLEPHRLIIGSSKRKIECYAGEKYHAERKDYDLAVIRKNIYPRAPLLPGSSPFFPKFRECCDSVIYLKNGEFVKGHSHDIIIEKICGESCAKEFADLEEWIAHSMMHLDIGANKLLQPFISDDFPKKYRKDIERIINFDFGEVFSKMQDTHKLKYGNIDKEKVREIRSNPRLFLSIFG